MSFDSLGLWLKKEWQDAETNRYCCLRAPRIFLCKLFASLFNKRRQLTAQIDIRIAWNIGLAACVARIDQVHRG